MNRQTKEEKEHTKKKFTPPLDWKDYDKNLDKQQQKNASHLVLAVVGLVFLIVFAYWYRHEKNFRNYENKTVSVDAEYISENCPQLFLTEAEIKLADTIWDIPEIQECMNSGRLTVISPEKIREEFGDVIPEEAEIQEICVKRGMVVIDYYIGEERTSLGYYGEGGSESGRRIYKFMNAEEEAFNSKTIGYSLEYFLDEERVTYEKVYMVKDLYGILFE